MVFFFVVAIYPLLTDTYRSCLIKKLPFHFDRWRHDWRIIPSPQLSFVSLKWKVSNGRQLRCIQSKCFLVAHPIRCTDVLWNLIKFHERRSKTEIHTYMMAQQFAVINEFGNLPNSFWAQHRYIYIRPKAFHSVERETVMGRERAAE